MLKNVMLLFRHQNHLRIIGNSFLTCSVFLLHKLTIIVGLLILGHRFDIIFLL